MPRSKNPVQSVTLTVSVTPQVLELLRKVAQSGFAARTEATVAEEMIRKGLNDDGLLSELVRQHVRKEK